MKGHHDDYAQLLWLICVILLCISIEQCEQADALDGIKHELELLNIKQQ